MAPRAGRAHDDPEPDWIIAFRILPGCCKARTLEQRQAARIGTGHPGWGRRDLPRANHAKRANEDGGGGDDDVGRGSERRVGDELGNDGVEVLEAG